MSKERISKMSIGEIITETSERLAMEEAGAVWPFLSERIKAELIENRETDLWKTATVVSRTIRKL